MDLRNYDFYNRFPDGTGDNFEEEILAYLKELGGQLTAAFIDANEMVEAEGRRVDALSASMSSQIENIGLALQSLDERVTALEQRSGGGNNA